MSDLSEDVFNPKYKKTCSFDEALEILAFGWRPVYDENLLDEVRERYPHFYYTINYFRKTLDWNSETNCLKYSENKKKYYIDLPHLRYRIETDEELEYYRKLQKSLSVMRNIIDCNPTEMKVSYLDPDTFTDIDVDILTVKYFKKKITWLESYEYLNEIRGYINGKEQGLIIRFDAEFIYNLYKKKFEQEHNGDEIEQISLKNDKVIDDTSYTTPEIQLINAFIRNPENIPLLTQRGNPKKLEDKLAKLNDELGLIKELTPNRIKGILSVIKSPEAKKSGNIPTPYGDSF